MINLLFFDVDGTLMASVNGKSVIPQSAIDSITSTREKGNYTFLCTGRSLAEIGDLANLGFDGIIGGGGCYVEMQHQVIYHQKFSKEEAMMLLEYFDHHDIQYFIECNDGIFLKDDFKEFMINTLFNGDRHAPFIQLTRSIECLDINNVNKISFFSYKVTYEEIEKIFGNTYHLVKSSWGKDLPDGGEIMLQGINKAKAIDKVLESIQEPCKIYAFGDSMNDREMLERADVAVVMGNYSHGVDQYADFITKDVLDDGIAYAMKYFNLV